MREKIMEDSVTWYVNHYLVILKYYNLAIMLYYNYIKTVLVSDVER